MLLEIRPVNFKLAPAMVREIFRNRRQLADSALARGYLRRGVLTVRREGNGIRCELALLGACGRSLVTRVSGHCVERVVRSAFRRARREAQSRVEDLLAVGANLPAHA